MSKQAESLPNSPEELLRYCENELARLRLRKEGARRQRALVLLVSLFLLGAGALLAFMLLFSRLQDLPRRSHDTAEAPERTAP